MTFDDLFQGGFARVKELIDQRVEETPTLEFKCKREPNKLDLHKDDRRALGEALSGFANATGGLLVIGVETERPEGVDRACAIEVIENINQVADRYRAYAADCAAPPVTGVRIAAVEDNGGAGVLLVEVPQGNARPHMSMAPGHQRYYRRVSDTFVPMLHYEVDEMMRLRTAPKLSFVYRIEQAGSTGGNRNFGILFGLKNASRSTAKFPFISYQNSPSQPTIARCGLDGNGTDLWPRLNAASTEAVIFAAGADRVLHPGQSMFVSRLEYSEVLDQRFRPWAVSELEGDELRLTFAFGCEDCPIESVDIRLSRDELLQRR